MKHLIKKNGEYTEEAAELINDVVEYYSLLVAEYMEKGYNSFEILGIITSAAVNAQRQAWIRVKTNEQEKHKQTL